MTTSGDPLMEAAAVVVVEGVGGRTAVVLSVCIECVGVVQSKEV